MPGTTIDDSSPQGRVPRIRFQSDAARIQFGLADVLMLLQRVFDDARQQRYWSAENVSQATSLAERFRFLAGAWSRLTPPEQLCNKWEDVSSALQGFDSLFDRAVSLHRVTDKPLVLAIADLQRDFTAEMEKLNVLERALLDDEKGLAQG